MLFSIVAIALACLAADGALADCTTVTQQFQVVETNVECPNIVLPPTGPQEGMGKASIEYIRFQATNGQPRDRRFVDDVVNAGPRARVPRRGKATIEPETLCSIRAHATNDNPGASSLFRGSDFLRASFAHGVRNAVRDAVIINREVWGTTDHISARDMVDTFDATPASAFFLPVAELDDNDNLGDYSGRAVIWATVAERRSTVSLTYSQDALDIIAVAGSVPATAFAVTDIVHVVSYCGCTSTATIIASPAVVTTAASNPKSSSCNSKAGDKGGKGGLLVTSVGSAGASSSAAPVVALVAAAIAVVVVAGVVNRRNRARAVNDNDADEGEFVVEHNDAIAI